MKPKTQQENRLGPVNPFTVGSVFIEAAKKLEWIVEDQTDRQRQYFISSKGFEEMSKLGMNMERVLLYRQPPEEQRQQRQQREQQRAPRTHHRSSDRRRH